MNNEPFGDSAAGALRLLDTWIELESRRPFAATPPVAVLPLEGAEKKRHFQLLLERHEHKLRSARHLLEQYRRNWLGGMRSLCEIHLRNRMASSQITAFYDLGKPGPQVGTFLKALALPTFMSQSEGYVSERSSDLISGLVGLAGKLDFPAVFLGQTRIQWDTRAVRKRIEAVFRAEKVFPEANGKRGGLVSRVTGRSNTLLDERKGQIARAIRLVLREIEADFAEWCSELFAQLEKQVCAQIDATLNAEGATGPDGLHKGVADPEAGEVEDSFPFERPSNPESCVAQALHALACRLGRA